MRVGYAPYSSDLRGPGDRRRFVYWAKKRGVPFEVLRDGAKYDVVVLSSLADLTSWSRWPRGREKIVLDTPDSYLDIGRLEPRAILRGPAKFLLRQHRHLEWSYHGSLERMCARADAVVCSTPEQSERIRPFNANVHPILDFHTEEVRRRKDDYRMGEAIHLFWEGIAANVFTLGRIAGALRIIADKRPLTLHIVTDLSYRVANASFVPARPTQRLLARALGAVPFALYQWHGATLASIAAACDMAVIPMALDIPVHRAKAENKLLLLWRMGLPVITSATPAYARTMKAAGVDMLATREDWQDVIERAASDETLRRESATRGRSYAEETHGEAANLARWDAVIDSVWR